MVGVAQSVEHQVVALVAAGSSPVTHPIFKLSKTIAEQICRQWFSTLCARSSAG